MPPFESILRSAIAERPDLVEHGLEVIGEEIPLPNAAGTRGFIDILAKDRFGNFVVVELKRSDTAARQAIHELLKYTELLQREMGIPRGKIRCIIASTHWEELRVPFSGATAWFPTDLRGYQIVLDATDKVGELRPVLPLARPSSQGLTLVQRAYCFSSRERRDKFFGEVAAELAEAGCPNSIGVRFDNAERAWPGYRFLLYLAIGQAGDEARSDDCMAKFSADDAKYALGFPVEDAAIADAEASRDCDEVEIGYSEKFAGLESSRYGWVRGPIERAGVFARQVAIVSDDQLAKDLAGYDGGNLRLYTRSFSPQIGGSIDDVLVQVSRQLDAIPHWRDGLVQWIVDHDDADEITVAIFTPADFPAALVESQNKAGARIPIPGLIAYVGPRSGEDFPRPSIRGLFAWDGKRRGIGSAFANAYLNPFLWAMLKDPESDNQFVGSLGISHRLIVEDVGSPARLVVPGAPLADSLPHDAIDFRADGVRLKWDGIHQVDDFLDEHLEEIESLVKDLKAVVIFDFDEYWGSDQASDA